MRDNFIIVDGHVHTFSSDEVSYKILQSFNKLYEITFDNPGTGTVEDVLGNMSKNGIDYTVMANFAPAKILHANNLWGIEASVKNSNLIPLVSFHPDMEGDLRAYLIDYAKAGAKGIKIHPMAQGFEPNHQRMQIVYEYCSEMKLPVVFHCGRVSNTRLNEYADLKMILPVIEKYTRMPVVLTHMVDGNIDDVLQIADSFKNVYFDTSIVITGFPPIMEVNEPSWLNDEVIVDLVNRIDAGRVIFGSDYPWGSPKHDLDRILRLNLTILQKKMILGENALKLYNIS